MLANLSVVEIDQARFEEASRIAREAEAIAERLGDANRIGPTAANRGLACVMLGRLDEAGGALHKAMTVALRERDLRVLISSFEATALLASRRGDDAEAVTMYGAAAKMTEDLHLGVPAGLETEKEDDLARLRSTLGDQAFERFRDEGRDLLLEEVISRAHRLHQI